MPGRLKKIVDHVKAKTYLKNLAVARMNLRLGVNVEDFKDDSADDPAIEAKLIETAKEILRVDKLDLNL